MNSNSANSAASDTIRPKPLWPQLLQQNNFGPHDRVLIISTSDLTSDLEPEKLSLAAHVLAERARILGRANELFKATNGGREGKDSTLTTLWV